MLLYDRAEWHFEGGLISRSADGATIIGFFTAWAILRNLLSAWHAQHSNKTLVRVLERKITGRQFVLERCQGMLGEKDLNPEGNAFATWYYMRGHYLGDYVKTLAGSFESMYDVDDSWKNFDRLAPVMSARFDHWSQAMPQA